MRLFLHQFKKDFLQTWIVWAIWFFFVLVQFGLAAWNVNAADLVGGGIYAQLIGFVPAIHAILLFVLIPILIFLEPPVGTTSSWLTRPMPPATILGSKLLALAILVVVPLLGQCVVLAAHHVILRDIVMAGVEIGLKELSWIALATALAVLCPNFGLFLIAAAILYILQYFSGWIWNCLSLLPASFNQFLLAGNRTASPFLYQSRTALGAIITIAFGTGVVAIQYLTRRHRLALAVALCGLLTSELATRYWPWDFVDLLVAKPAALHIPFDASSLRLQAVRGGSWSDQADPRGGPSTRIMSIRVFCSSMVPNYDFSFSGQGGEAVYPDGTKLKLPPFAPLFNGFTVGGMVFSNGNPYGIDMDALENSIGNLPILNGHFQEEAIVDIPNLFTLSSDLLATKGKDLGTATFQLKGIASGHRIVAEIPLKPGAFFSKGSERTTLISVLKGNDAVNIQLQKRSLNLLLAPSRPEQLTAQSFYLLLNRKRNEAVMSSGIQQFNYNEVTPNGLLSAFDLGDNRFEHIDSFTLPFGNQPGGGQPGVVLPVAIDDAWLADAVLVRVDPVPAGEFTTTLTIPDFALDLHAIPDENEVKAQHPDLDALNRIILPANPTRPDVWHYIRQILSLSARQRNADEHDPQIDMLAQVGPEHAVDLLIAAATGESFYPDHALKTLDLTGRPDAEQMVLRLLPGYPFLIGQVTQNHWEADAKPILLEKIASRTPGEYIDDYWIKALATLGDDPKVKAAILDLLPSQQNVIQVVIDNHWEADAKPILIQAIAQTKQGQHVDDRWLRLLDSFHDDSDVKAMLLRVLPDNQDTIRTVVENHWEADAKPILLDTLNKAKPGDHIDDRWFKVLASLPDQTGVKEAVLRVLPFCQNAILAVTQNHWETDAEPIMLDVFSKPKSGQPFDDRWFRAVAAFPDRDTAKKAVLAVLPLSQNAIIAVTQNHWEADAKPVLLDTLLHAKPGDHFDERWFQVLGSLADQSGVKEAVLHVIPFAENADQLVIQNHWEPEAGPLVMATLNQAKPNDHFSNYYIGIAVGATPAPGAKEAVLHVLPSNEEAIDFVTQNHWEADAAPILIRKMASANLGENINRKWVHALATLHDPATYPLLLNYTEWKLGFHDYQPLDDLRPLPASVVLELVNRNWKSVVGTNDERFALGPAAAWGISEALDRAATVLAEPLAVEKQALMEQTWRKDSARKAINEATPCPDRLLDSDMGAWYVANKDRLSFDPELGRFVFHAKPVSSDQSWLLPTDAMKDLGNRAMGGDDKAFDEIEDAVVRATEGLDPNHDEEKIKRIRSLLAGTAVGVIGEQVSKNPGLLAVLAAANQRPHLRSFVANAYGRAAEAGNDAALDALIRYPAHQWSLREAVDGLEGAIGKGNGKAIAFEAALPNDPKFTQAILNEASYQLKDLANRGNEEARAAYQTLQKAHAPSQDAAVDQ